MNQRNESDAGVSPAIIENREDGPRPATFDSVAVELAGLKARIEAARAIEPVGRELHCRDCFHKGRNAAIRVILGD